MNMRDTRRQMIDEVELLLANARLRDELEPYRDESIIARRASAGAYELDFFHLLGERLAEAHGTTEIYAHGLQDAVKVLCGTNRWTRRCEHLSQEVLQFLERHLQSQEGMQITCTQH